MCCRLWYEMIPYLVSWSTRGVPYLTTGTTLYEEDSLEIQEGSLAGEYSSLWMGYCPITRDAECVSCSTADSFSAMQKLLP